MKILIVLMIGAAVLAALYLLMIMPRMLGKPDTAPFREWLYAHRGLHCNGAAGSPVGTAEESAGGGLDSTGTSRETDGDFQNPAETSRKPNRDIQPLMETGEETTEGGQSVEGIDSDSKRDISGAEEIEEIAPENSLRAFQRAVDAGFGIELDVQMTKDHIPVVFHDFTLKRICGAEGKVCDYTCEELQRFSLCGSDQRIPRFEDVLKCVDGKVPLIVELKIEATDLSVCAAADGLLQDYPGMYCIESFNPLGLLWYRLHRRSVVRGQLSEAFLRESDFSGPLYFALQNLLFNWLTRPDFIAYNHRHYDTLSRRLCRGLYHNMAVAWTIKSREELEAAKRQFDLFIFDSFMPTC
ncbi:MAG: glycerophosphodiester phosphodiesterase [Roseburia sp.]|nr:glycerophosphodiester phosphodiesterase [Roseburia sp.]MCM1098989.1 glycerophosphodiester phosphodiesterase [Ruminococcus flavefaciens]